MEKVLSFEMNPALIRQAATPLKTTGWWKKQRMANMSAVSIYSMTYTVLQCKMLFAKYQVFMDSDPVGSKCLSRTGSFQKIQYILSLLVKQFCLTQNIVYIICWTQAISRRSRVWIRHPYLQCIINWSNTNISELGLNKIIII